MLYDIDFFPNYKLRDDGTVISFYTNPDGNPLKWCYTKNSCFVKLYNKNGNKMFHKSELQDVVALKQAEAKKPSVFVGIPNTTQYVVNSEDYRVLSFRANKEGKYLKWSESGNQKYVKLIIKNKIVVFKESDMKKLVHDYMNGNKIANETFEERFAVYTSGKNGKFVELVKSNEVKQFAVDYAAKMKVNLNIFKLVGKVRQKEVHVIEPVFEEIV